MPILPNLVQIGCPGQIDNMHVKENSLQEALLRHRDRAMRLSVEILQLQNIPFENKSPGHIVWHYLAIFTARRPAKRGICRRRVSVCLSVCLSVCVCVCLSHSGIVSKRLNVGSRK